MDYAENIQLVINTLEAVEVHGSKNMDRVLACIQHLTTIKKEMMGHAGSGIALQQRDTEDSTDPV